MDHQAEAARGAVETTGLPAAVLPDDVLANVLRRLAPRFLAASRCVCKAWRDVIDAHRLLRAELLPLSPGGIFINFNNYYISEFLARPSTAAARPSISGKHDYLPDAGIRSWSDVRDLCNGLLLVAGYDVLDRHQPPGHAMVFSITRFISSLSRQPDPAIEQSEWPPSLYCIHVYSSRTGC